MSGRSGKRVWALLGAFGLLLTMGVVVPTVQSPKTASAAPVVLDPADPANTATYPHYFGPYSNWANSPQTLANAVVTITPAAGDLTGTGATATANVLPKNAVTGAVGSIGSITITSPGTLYSAPPTVTIDSPGVTPTKVATATAAISAGVISSITVDQAGFGFTTPFVAITGSGTGATALASGGVDNLTLTPNALANPYLIQPIVVFTAPQIGTDTATAMAEMDANGVVTALTITNPGSGYTSAPTVTIIDAAPQNPQPLLPATAAVTIGIAQIDIVSGGTGYSALPTAPTVTITDIAGGLPGIDLGASATATVAVGGAVSSITVTAPGAGYLTPGIKKFVDTLAGLTPAGINSLGQYIPVAVADTTTYPGTDYYEIAVVQYRQQFSSSLPASGTLLRGYVQLATNVVPGTVALSNALVDGTTAPIVGHLGVDSPHYLGPTIVATKDKPVRIKFYDLLPTGVQGDLFLPVDTTLMGSGAGPDMVTLDANGVPLPMATDLGNVLDGVRNPMCGETPKPATCYSENRATLHLHGGVTPWISDGTPHQWITPAGENTAYPQGVSVSNVPDMPQPVEGDGTQTFFYTNQQSARLMFYHDHSWGITRLNVYAGEAAGYVITDPMEQSLVAPGGPLAGLGGPAGLGTPLIIQDKTFVSPAVASGNTNPAVGPLTTDPTWNATRWGGTGSLWTPHVYMPAQNPGDPSGMSAFGRWMYGPWFWPPAKDVVNPPIVNPYFDSTCDPNVGQLTPVPPAAVGDPCEPRLIPSTPNISVGMEAFNDTPIVNGTAYPTTTVDPKAYRYRVLNAANDRFWNLSWYVADPRTGTLSEVALKPAEVAAAQTDPVVFPTPDTQWSPKGPNWIQIGTEGGFLPAPVIVPAHETTWIMDPTRFDVGNVDQHSLLLGPAERADVVVDFSQFRGKTLILYNDAPAAFPARVPGYDYYTGGPDLTPAGAPTTLPGYGPNTRTIMQVKVSNTAQAVAFDRPNTNIDRMGDLVAAFAHHIDPVTLKPAGVFESSMDPIIVGQAAYNSAYKTPGDATSFVSSGWCNDPGAAPTAKCDGFARIQEQSFGPTPFQFKFDTLSGAQLSLPFQPKGMHDEMNSANFDEWGRMTANIGLEAPGATPLLQNIILFPYVNPPTEKTLDSTAMPSSLKVTPISSSTDGTQIWKITHNGVDTHPIHFHLYDVQILNRVTWDNIIIPPEPTELGWKDTVRVSPLEDTIVALRPIVPTVPFAVPDSIRPLNPALPLGARGDAAGPNGTEAGFNNTDNNGDPIPAIVNADYNFRWEYVFHCHILSHEEMDMMRPVDVIVPWTAPATPTGLTFTPGSIILNWIDGTPVDYTNPSTWANPTPGLGGSNPAAEIGFRIERTATLDNSGLTLPAAGATWEFVANVPANTTTFTDPIRSTDSYFYRVTAWNQGILQSDGTYASATASSSPVFVVGLGATTTSVFTVPNPSTVGQNVTFNATVAGVPSGTPTGGIVTFFDGVTSIGSTTVVNSIGTFNYAGLALGSHQITAVYAGDLIYASSASAAVTHVVNQGATNTVVTSSVNPSVYGAPVTFTATVSPTVGAVVPTGTVEFFDGATTLGIVTLAGGIANSAAVANLAVGPHTITATYSGDANFTGGTSAGLIQNVGLGNSTTVVTTSGTPSTYGTMVTFTATVSVAFGSPTGAVEFFDGASLGAPIPLLNGSASFAIDTLGGGSHAITATYSGDLNFSTSTSAVLTQVVNPTTSTTAVTSNGTPSVFGNPVVFTATVTVPFGSPTGNVEFFDGATSLGTRLLAGGNVNLTTTGLAVGSHSITVVYAGTANFLGSTSPAITQVVDKGATATVVTSSLNPSIRGDSVTFTATVAVTAGAGSPGGTVQFSVDGTNRGAPVAVVGGSASLSISDILILSHGNHSITAVYSGDASFTGSTSAGFNQLVLRATTTTVSSNRAPATFGQNVTFTARVRPVVNTNLIPTLGTVQFFIGGLPVGTPATLNFQGRATFSTNTLQVGSASVTAVYSGDGAVFAASPISAVFNQVVVKAASTTSMSSSPGTTWRLNQNVTFTARVTPLAATGTVQFYKDNVAIGGPVALDVTGRAVLVTSFSTTGAHTVSATYNGNANFNISTGSRTRTVI